MKKEIRGLAAWLPPERDEPFYGVDRSDWERVYRRRTPPREYGPVRRALGRLWYAVLFRIEVGEWPSEW